MKVLHICNGYVGSRVHTNLYRELDALGLEQTIFTCVYKKEEIDKNRFESKNTEFVYANVLRPFYRPFYHVKKWIISFSLEKRIRAKDYDCIHATTLFTDGAQAYELNKKYGIPYVVAVRNTDLNLFLEKVPYAWSLGRKILLNATRIVFISKAMASTFENHHVIAPIVSKIRDKFILCPNGVDSYWLQNVDHTKRTGKNILYVGDFSQNKNVKRVIDAVLSLSSIPRYSDIHLTLVGGGSSVNGVTGNSSEQEVLQLIDGNKDRISFLGKIYDRPKLREVYSKSDVFVMPSIHETFGLVYVEALSQNIPVVFSANQGIDGFFSAKAGERVNPLSVSEIKAAIMKIIENHSSYSNEDIDFQSFDWSFIAEKYLVLYNSLI